ncbi:hypothetical protein [Treponema putidum]|uniref:hypothetical protein n=1 Tax=Treponema putidum TaxID=221027 RepID=UPI0021046AB4|nr:hypothetical protein [Treponema putidum]
MKAINVTQAHTDLFKILAFVNDNSQPLTLTNSKGKNAALGVCLSENEVKW